jgi:hypothetical protein
MKWLRKKTKYFKILTFHSNGIKDCGHLKTVYTGEYLVFSGGGGMLRRREEMRNY